METFSGIKIRNILLHNQNWWNFFIKYTHLIRESIVINVCKILACQTQSLGFHLFVCTKCGHNKTVCHTCKSRFCSSCGKKATEQWVENNLNVLPNVPWQHITFTLPQELREFFWLNRHLTNHIAKIPAALITQLGKRKNVIPGIFMAIHTFGRDLKKNVHFHVSITAGGLSLDHKQWINDFYIHHQTIKNMWKQQVIATLRNLYKHDNQNTTITLPVEEFIQRLIIHIPDANFRLIRYYNWLSNRTRAELLPLVYKLVEQTTSYIKKITWRSMFHKTFGYDPIECQVCKLIMNLAQVRFVTKNNILDQHKNLATVTG